MEFAYKFRQDGGMSTNAQRFGDLVKQRRLDLDYNQLDLADAGGPSNSTLTKIENGVMEDLNRATARKLDKGLRWVPGSARTAWAGGDPTPVPSDVEMRDADWLRDEIERSNLTEAARLALLERLSDSTETA